MKVIGKYFNKLEKKSGKYLTKNQLSDCSFHVHDYFFNDSCKIVVAFCNSEIKKSVRKNYFLKIITKLNVHVLIYSKIVPRLCSLNKREVFYLFEVEKNNNKYSIVLTKELPIKMNKSFNIKKISNSGHPGIEQSALLAAKYFNIHTGGYAPKHFLTADGINNNLMINFGLTDCELLNRNDLIQKNIETNHGTLIICPDKKELRHFRYLFSKLNKSYFSLSIQDIYIISECEKDNPVYRKIKFNFVKWLIDNWITEINITGTKNSTGEMNKRIFMTLVKLMNKNFPDIEKLEKKYLIVKELLNETEKAE